MRGCAPRVVGGHGDGRCHFCLVPSFVSVLVWASDTAVTDTSAAAASGTLLPQFVPAVPAVHTVPIVSTIHSFLRILRALCIPQAKRMPCRWILIYLTQPRASASTGAITVRHPDPRAIPRSHSRGGCIIVMVIHDWRDEPLMIQIRDWLAGAGVCISGGRREKGRVLLRVRFISVAHERLGGGCVGLCVSGGVSGECC